MSGGGLLCTPRRFSCWLGASVARGAFKVTLAAILPAGWFHLPSPSIFSWGLCRPPPVLGVSSWIPLSAGQEQELLPCLRDAPESGGPPDPNHSCKLLPLKLEGALLWASLDLRWQVRGKTRGQGRLQPTLRRGRVSCAPPAPWPHSLQWVPAGLPAVLTASLPARFLSDAESGQLLLPQPALWRAAAEEGGAPVGRQGKFRAPPQWAGGGLCLQPFPTTSFHLRNAPRASLQVGASPVQGALGCRRDGHRPATSSRRVLTLLTCPPRLGNRGRCVPPGSSWLPKPL